MTKRQTETKTWRPHLNKRLVRQTGSNARPARTGRRQGSGAVAAPGCRALCPDTTRRGGGTGEGRREEEGEERKHAVALLATGARLSPTACLQGGGGP